MLTIAEVRARGVDLPLAAPAETAAGVMRSRPLVLVDLLTEEGVTGRSYLRCYTPAALEPLTRLVAAMGALVAGAPASPAEVVAVLEGHVRLLGVPGLVGMAVAGIDMAVWDACALAAGVPLATLLGGTPRPVPAYTSLRSMAPAAAAADAGRAVDAGFRAVKVKVGGAGAADDLAAVRAVRAAVGDGVAVMVDYNQSLSVDEALARVRALDDEGLHWIEEPTRADDVAGHARIAAAARTPVQLGENAWGVHDLERAVAARACDHLMLDAMRTGGVSGWRRAAALAEAAGLPVSSHAFPEVSAHLLAVTPTGHLLEHVDDGQSVLAAPLRLRDGAVVVPDGPGTGLVWDEEVVGRTRRC